MTTLGQWLAVDGEVRIWIARMELQATERAPALPLEQWSDSQMLAAMFRAIERRADIGEPALSVN